MKKIFGLKHFLIFAVFLALFQLSAVIADAQVNRDIFSDPQKVNEYVSWYLNGTIYRAEYAPLDMKNPVDVKKLTSLSGPLNKRLPLAFWDLMKINTIESATKVEPYIDPDTGLPDPTKPQKPQNHNQIVVCASKFLGFIGPAVPHPCYPNPKRPADGPIYRLKDWEGDLSILNGIANALGTDVWNSRKPPLPWGLDQQGNPMTDLTYRKYYNEWRGNTCFIIPVINALICFDNPAINNTYADLFPYVPLANNSDKNALHLVASPQLQPNPGTIACYSGSAGDCTNPSPPDEDPQPPANNGQLDGDNPDIVHEPVLFYPHTLETVTLSDMLDTMFTPSKCLLKFGTGPLGFSVSCDPDKQAITTSPITPDYEDLGCEIVDVRSNPGDKLFQSSQDSRIDDLSVYVDIQIDAIGCPAGPIDNWIAECGCNWPSDCPTRHGCELQDCDLYDPVTNPFGKCASCGPYPNSCSSYPSCNGGIQIKIPSTPKIPYAEEIWKSTVVGNNSTFRRIFPKVVEGAPVDCIADIEGISSTQYVPLPDPGYTPLQSIETPLSVNPATGTYGLVHSELYFPYQGTVYEYFLRGIQTALRPRGYGNPIPNGTECGKVCGELPKLPQDSSCAVKNTQVDSTGTTIPPAFAEILEAAGATYHTPAQLIIGILFGEGTFNGGSYKGTGIPWSQTNAINWATCEKLPECSGPETSIVGFIPVFYESLVRNEHVLEALKKIDPTKTQVDPCNLLDVSFVLAAYIHNLVQFNALAGHSCYGSTMGNYNPQSCGEWYGGNSDSMFETAIRAWEYGTYYDPTQGASLVCPVPGACNCATVPGGCAIGGFPGSACLVPGDGCEKKSGGTSHNACVWQVAH